MDMREGRRRHRASKAKPSQAWLHVVGGNQENVVRVFLFGGRGTSDLSCPDRKPVEVVRFGRLDWLVVCTVRNRREKQNVTIAERHVRWDLQQFIGPLFQNLPSSVSVSIAN